MPQATPTILASRVNNYAGSPLDRAGLRRDDAEWINAQLADPKSVFVVVWRSKTLITAADSPAGVFLTGAEAQESRVAGGPWRFSACGTGGRCSPSTSARRTIPRRCFPVVTQGSRTCARWPDACRRRMRRCSRMPVR